MASLPFFFFFFNDTATTEIYTLSLHDALPISRRRRERHRDGRRFDIGFVAQQFRQPFGRARGLGQLAPYLAELAQSGRREHGKQHELAQRSGSGDRKSTRLNSSH